MEQIEIKEYGLRFIIDKDVRLRVGSSVALVDKPPITANDFYWIESVILEPFGLMYTVYGLEKPLHACELYPLLPVLVSDDVLDYHDKFYHEGNIYECSELKLDDDLNMWVVSNENQESFIESSVEKVVVTPEMFGWLYNEGPPHDHNMNWGDSRYLEGYIQSCLIPSVKNGFKMSVMVTEISEFNHIPTLHEGKIIIDAYNLLRKSSIVTIF
jgi:hypothetical protein